MTPVADNSLRQAAAFIRGLAPDAAASMLRRLSADEARSLRAAIAELDEGGSSDEAASPSRASSVSDDGTVELDISSAPKLAPPRPKVEPRREPPMDGAAWLGSLRDADPEAIATYLSREQPRAIALVLGYLPADLSARVLQCLHADEQARVVAQLAEQDDADPDSLRVIASGLSEWVGRKQEEERRRTTRVATIRQILAATPESQRSRLLEGLAKSEPEIARSLNDLASPAEPEEKAVEDRPVAFRPDPPKPQLPAGPRLAFEDLDRVDGRALAEAIGTLAPRVALLALAGATDSLLQKLTAGLPRAAARDLRTRIHRVGPTTLAEIDNAQVAFASAVSGIVARRRSARSPQPLEA